MRGRKEINPVPLTERRMLSMYDFSVYTGVGGNSARKLADISGAIFRAGRRILIDRVKYDKWCDAHNEVSID